MFDLNKLLLGLLLGGVFILGACNAPPGDPPTDDEITKDQLKQAKQDSTLWAKECTRLGMPVDCEICAVKGYYSDGECDTFCTAEDEDCISDPVDPSDCLPVMCEMYCPDGFALNDRGCEICQCAEPSVIEGTVTDLFIGEMDPFVVGDVCIFFVRDAGGHLYGMLEDFDLCEYTALFDGNLGAKVSIPLTSIKAITNAAVLAELNDYDDEADYFDLVGDITVLP